MGEERQREVRETGREKKPREEPWQAPWSPPSPAGISSMDIAEERAHVRHEEAVSTPGSWLCSPCMAAAEPRAAPSGSLLPRLCPLAEAAPGRGRICSTVKSWISAATCPLLCTRCPSWGPATTGQHCCCQRPHQQRCSTRLHGDPCRDAGQAAGKRTLEDEGSRSNQHSRKKSTNCSVKTTSSSRQGPAQVRSRQR